MVQEIIGYGFIKFNGDEKLIAKYGLNMTFQNKIK